MKPPVLTEHQASEYFHLAFLRFLQMEAPPGSWVLKGGANLRYCYGSHRYSRDVDADVADEAVAPWAFEETVDRVLGDRRLASVLGLVEITLGSIAKPKQTDTTQRWKIGLVTAAGRVATKVEFSRRDAVDDRHTVVRAQRHLSPATGMVLPLVDHYLPQPALNQKVRALADPNRNRPRDLHDVHLLLELFPEVSLGEVSATELAGAAETVAGFEYPDYADQVVRFLDADIRDMYAGEDAFRQVQDLVADRLLGELQARAAAAATTAAGGGPTSAGRPGPQCGGHPGGASR